MLANIRFFEKIIIFQLYEVQNGEKLLEIYEIVVKYAKHALKRNKRQIKLYRFFQDLFIWCGGEAGIFAWVWRCVSKQQFIPKVFWPG